MQEISLDSIKLKAESFHRQGLKWHFHILTPDCKFNEDSRYVFIIESPTRTYVYYSNKAEKELGKELVPLLHGSKVLKEEATTSNHQPSEKVLKIIQLAKYLNEQGKEWHHHVLFPGCIYNKNSPKFTLIFEGAEEVLENVTQNEPTADIKLIEPLFYRS